MGNTREMFSEILVYYESMVSSGDLIEESNHMIYISSFGLAQIKRALAHIKPNKVSVPITRSDRKSVV